MYKKQQEDDSKINLVCSYWRTLLYFNCKVIYATRYHLVRNLSFFVARLIKFTQKEEAQAKDND